MDLLAAVLERLHQLYFAFAHDTVTRQVESSIAQVFTPAILIGAALILLLERWIPAEPRRHVVSAGLIQDAVWFLAGQLFHLTVVMAGVGAMHAFYKLYLSSLTFAGAAALPLVPRLALAILWFDFLAWLHHLIRHKVRSFWIFHSVHHSSREMNLFTDDRVHFMDTLVAQAILVVPLRMVDLPLDAGVWLVLCLRWHTRLVHANLRTGFGRLGWLVVSPQYHRIHHSIEERHRDRNFGVLLAVWDRLFGTAYSPAPDEYPATGIADLEFPLEERRRLLPALALWWRQCVYPLEALAAHWRSRLGRPARLTADAG